MSTSEPTGGENATDPTTRIETLLSELRDSVDKTFEEIEQIAKQEHERLGGTETHEGIAWNGFAAFGMFTDVSTAWRNIQLQIASVRGMMTYRGLDQPPPKP